MRNSYFLLGLLGLFPCLSSSCFQPVEDASEVLEDDVSAKKKSSLKLTTRSSTGEIDYPVLVLAYDADGNKQAQQVIASADEQIQLKLAEGSYHVSAITGYTAYVEPKSYSSFDAMLKVPAEGTATKPLFVGSADVELGSKSATVEVVMSSRTSSLDVSLHGLPATVEATSIAISRQFGAYGMNGSFSSTLVAKKECSKSADGIWTTGVFYVLPGADVQTVLTITITDKAQQYSYGYTLNEPLEAAVPYILNGTYKEGERVGSFDLTGSLTVENWKNPRTYNFEFGEGASSDNSGEEDDVLDDNDVASIPSEKSLWKNHVVAMVTNTDAAGHEADLLLISRREYTNVYSAVAEGHEMDAKNKAAAYTEEDLAEWKIPSNAQMQELKKKYSDDTVESLNEVIAKAGGDPIRLKDGKDNVRYLCSNALQAIGFSSTSKIGDAGATVKYSLRLVKKVHVVVAD